MVSSDIDRVTVLGAGSMGHGIAEVAAIAGYDVVVRDIEQDLVDDGLENIEWSLGKLDEKGQIAESADEVLARVSGETDLETAVSDADLVIEAIPEVMDLKQDTFADLDDYAPEGAILASNTSGLSITEIGSATDRPDQVIGLHFFNPPVKMQLVEVVHGEQTSDETVAAAHDFVDAIDKTAIDAKKDVHGFIVNNVMMPFLEEPAWMVHAGEATIEEADAAMVYDRGYPMGPFELNDFGGIDIAEDFMEGSERECPPPFAEKVENEHLGKKTGQGFYDWEEGGPTYAPEDAGQGFDTLRVEARMVNEAARLVGDDIASAEDVDLGTRLGLRFPEGACRLGDQLGLDRVLEKLRGLHEETGADRFEPDPYLVELVEAGRTGEDAGAGFHDYSGDFYQYINTNLTDEGVFEVEFDRTERLNAFSQTMFDEVKAALEDVDIDEVSCVVFSGAGDAFSAGADITGFMTAEPTEMMDVDETVQAIDNFDRPTIAKIDGFCLGAGLEISLACDLRVATERSQIGAPEINLGLIPGGGGTQRLTRVVGEGRAKEMIFSGEQVSAEQAEEWGLLNRAVPAEDFEESVDEFVGTIAGGPKTALKVAKRVIDDGQDASLEAGLDMESQAFGLLTTTDDMVEGVVAFRNDREPEFE